MEVDGRSHSIVSQLSMVDRASQDIRASPRAPDLLHSGLGGHGICAFVLPSNADAYGNSRARLWALLCCAASPSVRGPISTSAPPRRPALLTTTARRLSLTPPPQALEVLYLDPERGLSTAPLTSLCSLAQVLLCARFVPVVSLLDPGSAATPTNT